MNSDPRDLKTIQRWMQAVITHPLGVVSGIESSDARKEIDVSTASIESVVMPSNSLDSIERLSVYGDAYYARLLECVREMFPALSHALSEELFDSFAFSYLQNYPSRNYSLARLPDHFIQFLEETRPEFEEADQPTSDESPGAPSWPDFLIDLAQLEWTIDQAFDGPGVENEATLTAKQIADVSPEHWPDARLEPVVCLRLLAFKYPVNDYYTAFRRDEDPSFPEPANTYVAITRLDYIVRRIELSRPQFELLSAIVAGDTVGDAIAVCAAEMTDLNALAESLQNWFGIWSTNEFFQRIITSSP